MKKLYQVLQAIMVINRGFLMLELIVSLALLAVCSSLIAQWYMQVLAQEKNVHNSLELMVEAISCMNRIKARQLPIQGSQKNGARVFEWKPTPFGTMLSGHWVTLQICTETFERTLIFGVP